MKEMVMEVILYRELLYMLTWKDIKVRYKQSIMGFLWAIFMPMMIVLAGIVIKFAFSYVAGKGFNGTDIATISVKALPWSFFIGSVRFATNSLTSNGSLVTKIYFPREVLPLAAVMANLFDFLIAASALTVVMAVLQVKIGIHILWLPLILVLLVILTAGICMFLACANLFFRDVKYVVEVILTFAIFFTPVFYDVSMFGKWAPLLLLNPVGTLLEAIKDVTIMNQPPDLLWLAYAAACSVGGLLLSWTIFHRAEFMFAERI